MTEPTQDDSWWEKVFDMIHLSWMITPLMNKWKNMSEDARSAVKVIFGLLFYVPAGILGVGMAIGLILASIRLAWWFIETGYGDDIEFPPEKESSPVDSLNVDF